MVRLTSLLAAAGIARAAVASSSTTAPAAPEIVPGAYIVEYEGDQVSVRPAIQLA
jgi:hypothetical protein